jgi:hypothetical protein
MTDLLKLIHDFYMDPVNNAGIKIMAGCFATLAGIMYLSNKLDYNNLKKNNLDKITEIPLKKLCPRYTSQLYKELCEYDETGEISEQIIKNMGSISNPIYRWTDFVPEATKSYKLSKYKEHDQIKRLENFFRRDEVQIEILKRTTIGYMVKDVNKLLKKYFHKN